MNKELFAVTKNGQAVWLDSDSTHAITHFTADPLLSQHIKTALGKLEAIESSIYTTIDFDAPIGYSDLVETNNMDEIVYAKRIGRDIFTRFTKSRQPIETNMLTIWIQQNPDTSYKLKSAWFGPKVPAFPGNEWEVPESKEFWKTHALAWGKQAIIEGTETTVCPW